MVCAWQCTQALASVVPCACATTWRRTFALACAQGDLKDKWRNWQRNVANGWSTARVYMPDDLKQRIEKMVHEYSNQTGGGEGGRWGGTRAGKLVGKGGCGLCAGWTIGALGKLVRRQALQCAGARDSRHIWSEHVTSFTISIWQCLRWWSRRHPALHFNLYLRSPS